MKIIYLKKIKLPEKSGVYFFIKNKKIIYIGKATNLKDRVRSYFSKDLIDTRGPLLVDMVFHADQIKWEETDSVLEALILEANLIKKYQPKYNTKEKSDKSFNYVCISKDDLPKVLVVRGKDLAKQKFSGEQKGFSVRRRKLLFGSIFGPYPNSTQLKEALKIIRKIFPFYDDKSKNYKEFYRQIELVPNTEEKKKYLNNIKNIKLFFQGKKKRILSSLEKDMKKYAKAREFEKAGEIKKQIFSLKHINDIALIKNENTFMQKFSGEQKGSSARRRKLLHEGIWEGVSSVFRIEAYDIAHMSGKNMVGVMTVTEDGEIDKSEYKKFKIRSQNNANDTGALAEVLERRLKHVEWTLPSLIVVDGGKAQINIANKILENHKMKIPVVSVLKDERHKPKDILGNKSIIQKYRKDILLVNNEAHRFAIKYHKDMRGKNFLSSSK